MNDNKTYSTDFLIDRFYQKYEKSTGKTDVKSQKHNIKPLQIKIENRKTCIQNFVEICDLLKRNKLDIEKYIKDELNVETAISSSGLILSNTYNRDRIEPILRNYIKKYVQCYLCKSLNTKLEKENRINYLKCNDCHANSVI